jgi:acetyl esterase/lipase
MTARTVGVARGDRVMVSLCHAGSSWTVADVDPRRIKVEDQTLPTSGPNDLLKLSVLRTGSNAVRLVGDVGKTGSGGQRTFEVVLEGAPLTIRVTHNVPLTPVISCGKARCTINADVYAPATGSGWPVLVFLRGGPGGLGARSGYADYLSRLAAKGLVIFSADYRDEPSVGGRYPLAFADAACAVRVARHTGPEFGGSGTSITLAGHSLGGYVGAVVALSANAFASSCSATGAGVPDAFVGIAGPYDLSQPTLQKNFTSVLGGTRAQVPSAWQAADPLRLVGHRAGVRFRLVQGSVDPTVNPAGARALEQALERASFNTALTMVANGTHVSLTAPGRDGDWTIATILSALR